MRNMRKGWLGLATAIVLAGPAAAAPDQIVLREGPPITGEVVGVTEGAVQVRTSDAVLTVEFARVAPDALYAILRDRTDRKDAAARLALAETCVRYGAWTGARAELDGAAGLDATLRERVQQRLAEVDDLEGQALYSRGLDALLANRHQEALECFRGVADRFADTRWAARARDMAVKAVAGLESAAPSAPAEGEKRPATPAEKQAQKLADHIARLQKSAEECITDAEKLNKEGLEFDAKGNVTRASRAYDDAVEKDTLAKRYLDATVGVQRYATDLAVLESAQKRIETINKHLVLVYLNLASLHMVERNFKRARGVVNLALQIEPTNQRALELKQKIDAESITRKVSDLTNAKGKVTGGGR